MQSTATDIIPITGLPCTVSLTRGLLKTALQVVAPFSDADSNNLALQGVLFEVRDDKPNELTLVATNGHVLVKFTIPVAVTGKHEARSILLVNDVKTMTKALSGSSIDLDLSVDLFLDATTARIETIHARHSFNLLVSATFPPYEQLMSEPAEDGTSSICMNPDYVYRACKAASLLKRAATIKLGASALDPMWMTVDAHEAGKLIVVTMPMRHA